jgi:hypothetical protein
LGGIGGFSFFEKGTTFLTDVGIDCESLAKKQPKRYLQLLALLIVFAQQKNTRVGA